MSTSYEFNTASHTVEELSDLFCTVLDLERLKPLAASPISGDAWWASVASLPSSGFVDEGRRLQAPESFASITFVPNKSISWEDEARGLVRIVKSVVNLLVSDPGSSGFLEFYDEIIVLEKRRGGPIVVDPRLMDKDDLDDQEVFAPLLAGCKVESIEQF